MGLWCDLFWFFDIFNQVINSQNDKCKCKCSFCCFDLDLHDFERLLEVFVACGILQVFCENFSNLGCIGSICDVSNFLDEDRLSRAKPKHVLS